MSGLISQTIVVVPTTTADYNQSYVGQLDVELTLTVQITPAISIDGLDLQLQNMPAGGLWLKAHAAQVSALPPVTDIERLSNRSMSGVVVAMSTPAIISGRPMNPLYWGQSTPSITMRTDTGHLAVEDDPDPIWDSVHSRWIREPPEAGVGDMRWTVNSMPDPALFPDSTYPVGAHTSLDGSAGMDNRTYRWAADSSTPTAPSWNSAYPYKPQMVSYVHRNSDGSTWVQPRGLQFNMHYVQHMWLDMGMNKSMPFSWIMVCLVLNFSGNIYRHYLLDSGKNPLTSIKNPTMDNVSQDIDLPGEEEGLGYRNHMSVSHNHQYLTNETGRSIHVLHPAAPKPKMYFGVWDGAHSKVGNWAHGLHYGFKGALHPETHAHRYYVMGRDNGRVGIRYSSQMVMFEARFWNRALTGPEIFAQYCQLATTWKFSRYK